MTTDDELARDLRALADHVAPALTVSTHRVLPRARRRRTAQRTAGAVGALAVLGAAAVGGWSAIPWPGSDTAPAGGVTADGTARPTPLPESTAATSGTSGMGGPVVRPEDGTVAPVRSSVYWYLRSEPADGSEVVEQWLSLTDPGLVVVDGDLGSATQVGPAGAPGGTWVIDGERYEPLLDTGLLPVDPDLLAGVMHASVFPDQGSGTDDDKVFAKAKDLLTFNAGLLPEDLRRAVWEVATSLPGSTVSAGTDAHGRAGQVLRYTGSEGTTQIVLDPTTALVLAQTSPEGGTTLYTTMGPADLLPTS